MAAKKPVDASTLATNWTLQRVQKPTWKLYPGPRIGSEGGWRTQLFMDGNGCLYERRRMTALDRPVERWFAVTSFEATPDDLVRMGASKKLAAKIPADHERPSKSERAAAKKRDAETVTQYSINIGFSDLVDELEFAITDELFGEEGQKLLRRIIKRVLDARILFHKLGEPPTPPKPPRQAPPIVPAITDTIH